MSSNSSALMTWTSPLARNFMRPYRPILSNAWKKSAGKTNTRRVRHRLINRSLVGKNSGPRLRALNLRGILISTVVAVKPRAFFSQGVAMAHQGKQSNEGTQPASKGSALVRPQEQSQL